MMFVRKLSDQEHRELRLLARREVGRVSERIRMVLLSSRGYSVSEIAAIFECDPATVRLWLDRFEAQGVNGLHDRPRPGRPRKANAVAQNLLCQQFDVSPTVCGYPCTGWTVATLAAHLCRDFGLSLSPATVRRTLLQLGYRWRRPRHELRQDPEQAAKAWQLARQLLEAPPEAVILFEDECDLHLLPVLRAMWMRKGQQVRVPTPGTNRKRAVFGMLELDSGRWCYQVFEHKRTAEFIAFLEQLRQAYSERPLWLVLDNASIHKAKPVWAWLQAHPTVKLLWLPPYAGHEQNPVEKVWWRLKGQVAANRLYGSIEVLVDAVHAFFHTFTPETALQLTA